MAFCGQTAELGEVKFVQEGCPQWESEQTRDEMQEMCGTSSVILLARRPLRSHP